MKSHLKIEEIEPNPNLKTRRFRVISAFDDTELGIIRWYGGWRQYVFYPDQDCIWSWDCLKELSEFIRALMEEKKNVRSKKV